MSSGRDAGLAGGLTVIEGVNMANSTWLSAMFGITQQSVRNKLAACPGRIVRGRGTYYPFREAAEMLTPPSALAIAAFLETAEVSELPMSFQKIFWETQKVRLHVEREADVLWDTQDVVGSLSDLLQRMKAAVQLFPDRVHRAQGLTGAQRTTIVGLCDELLGDIHHRIREMADEKTTGNENARLARKLNGRADPVADIL